MARIRTIKPELPQSESMGAISREARLLFILLWTIADDAGRARAASRMLASLLYPYDDDAPRLIEGWLVELEKGRHIRRYEVDGSTYLDIPNWLKHQKIDRPSESRLPVYEPALASPREPSRAIDDGPRTLDLGPGTLDPCVDDARATPPKKPAIGDEAFALADRLMRLQRLEVDDPRCIAAAYAVEAWLTKGWKAEVIESTVAIVMSRKPEAPGSLRYFEKAIAAAHAEAARPLPVANILPGEVHDVRETKASGVPARGGVLAAADRLVATLARFDEAPGLCLGEGQAPVRAISAG